MGDTSNRLSTNETNGVMEALDKAGLKRVEDAVMDAVGRISRRYGSVDSDFTFMRYPRNDEFGTCTIALSIGRNESASKNASHYFLELAMFVDMLRDSGFLSWPIDSLFDVPDDRFVIVFGIKPMEAK